LGTPGLDKGEW